MGKLSQMKKQSKGTFSNPDVVSGMDVILKGQLPEDKDKIVRIDISKIKVNPNNDYRLSDTDEGIAALADDIEKNGLLHNLVVSKRENGVYIIISGERRFRALNLLFAKEQDNKGDAAKYRTIPCRVVEGLSERQEMIMLDAANLQTRGGAGDEAHVRNAMVRYRNNVKAEYGLSESEAKNLLVQITPFSKSSVNSNIKIRDMLREELKNLLDEGELTKRAANSLVKLSQTQQKVVSDAILALKDTFGFNREEYQVELEKAVEGFVAASDEVTDDRTAEKIQSTCNEVAAVISNKKMADEENKKQAGGSSPSHRVRALTKWEKQEAQRDTYLKKCGQIKKGLADLSKLKTVSRIKEFDANTDEDSRKVILQIDEIVKIATELRAQLEEE